LEFPSGKISADSRLENGNREIAAVGFFGIFSHGSDFIVLSAFADSSLKAGQGVRWGQVLQSHFSPDRAAKE